METIFWVMAGLVLYVYAGYPILLWLLRAAGLARPNLVDNLEPTVTILISAYNEVGVIAEKISNTLSLDYPIEKLEIIIISDCSDDGTDEAVQAFNRPNVKLLRMPDRGGKTLGLNAAVQISLGEILVFSDANAMYERQALRNISRNFFDSKVGAVIGESAYADSEGNAQKSESLYWKYETSIKVLETSIGSVVGGDGAIYAIRKTLYKPMPADALSDFVNPIQIVMSGYRCIYEPNAKSIEEATDNMEKEFRRKVRIVNRAWRALWAMPSVLNPFKFGFFSIEVLSHKLLRWLMPGILLVLFLISIPLSGTEYIYSLALVAQLALYGFAIAGYLRRESNILPRIFSVPYYFCLVNYASARGIVEAFFGKTYTTWNTPRAK